MKSSPSPKVTLSFLPLLLFIIKYSRNFLLYSKYQGEGIPPPDPTVDSLITKLWVRSNNVLYTLFGWREKRGKRDRDVKERVEKEIGLLYCLI